MVVLFKDGREEFISNPAEFPDVTDPKARVGGVEEPMGKSSYQLIRRVTDNIVNATIFVPNGEPSNPDWLETDVQNTLAK